MTTPLSLLEDLKSLGIQPADKLMVHSSLRTLGPVQGGADTVLDTLMDAVSQGMLILPTHTWREWNNADGIFDPATEPSCVGALTERFRQRAGVNRSWHPTHSVAAWGEGAADYVIGEEFTTTPCPRGGCWGRLYDLDAKILFLGAPVRANTYLHSVEEWFHIPNRLANEATTFRIRTPDGSLLPCKQYRHFSTLGDVSQHYGKIEPQLCEAGIAHVGRIGDARCVLISARALADWISPILQANPGFFDDSESSG